MEGESIDYFGDIDWDSEEEVGDDPVCPLCGESDWMVYGDYGICEECVQIAANDFVFQRYGKRDWRFATEEELEQQEREKKSSPTKQKAKIPAALRTEVFERDGYKCLCCGTQKKLRCDHVLPESLGGPMDASNMQTLCESCNSKKGTKHIDYRTNMVSQISQ